MLILEAAIQPTSKKHPNFKRLLNVGETTVRHTDSEGKVFFDNLDQGTYQITEIKTEPGNALLKEPIIFTLPFTMTMEEATQYQNVDFDSAKEDVGYTNKWYFYNCKYDITNNAVFRIIKIPFICVSNIFFCRVKIYILILSSLSHCHSKW